MLEFNLPPSIPDGFETKKRKFFIGRALQERRALDMHIQQKLWERDAAGNRDWGNVAEHCLVEVARVEAFSDLLGFDDSLRKDIATAAALHDFSKRRERNFAPRRSFLGQLCKSSRHSSR